MIFEEKLVFWSVAWPSNLASKHGQNLRWAFLWPRFFSAKNLEESWQDLAINSWKLKILRLEQYCQDLMRSWQDFVKILKRSWREEKIGILWGKTTELVAICNCWHSSYIVCMHLRACSMHLRACIFRKYINYIQFIHMRFRHLYRLGIARLRRFLIWILMHGMQIAEI